MKLLNARQDSGFVLIIDILIAKIRPSPVKYFHGVSNYTQRQCMKYFTIAHRRFKCQQKAWWTKYQCGAFLLLSCAILSCQIRMLVGIKTVSRGTYWLAPPCKRHLQKLWSKEGERTTDLCTTIKIKSTLTTNYY